MQKAVKIGIATVTAAMVGVGGYAAYNIATALTGGHSAAKKPRTVVDQPPTQQQADEAAKAFLDAWSKGDLDAAGKLTDLPDTADATLVSFRDKVKPTALTFTMGGPTASASPSPSGSPSASPSPGPSETPQPNSVPVVFQAKAEFEGTSKPWNYQGKLAMVKMSDGKAAVHWTTTVIHPHLTSGKSISVRPITAPPSSVVDRNGKALNSPSLTPLIAQIKTDPAPGEAGTGVVITDDSGKGKADQLFTITDPKPAPALKLTIDAGLQAAAESAVQAQSNGGTRPASLVAIEPSTGNVLAIANAPATGFNRAMSAAIAPGSTMKVMTAAALLESGLTPDTPMPCPSSTTVSGQTVTNDFPEAHDEYKLSDDFANSCNTAFINKGREVLKPDSLPGVAKDFFGLNLDWKVGVPSVDSKVPVASGANDMAAELFGQGKVTMNSLAMASIAATVQSGTFHQPILVAGMTQAPAARTLSPATLDALRSMMARTAHSGTAAPAMSGLSGNVGAKTGTAEVDNKANNSWFTSYRGNLAVAAEVEGGGHGVDAAGPAAAKVLKVGNGG